MSSCRADSRAGGCSNGRTDDGPGSGILIHCLLRVLSDLLRRPLPADSVIRLELLK
jgi:hypothetical protein